MAGNILEELEFNAGDLIKVSEKIRAFDREIYNQSMDSVLWFSLHVQKPQSNICPIAPLVYRALK